MNENKNPVEIISRDLAETEFALFCENNGIEHDETAMNEEEKVSFGDIKKRFIESCVSGRVEVDGTSIKYKISNFSPEGFKGETVIIKRPSGQAFTAMDGYSEKHNIQKLYGFISAITGKDIKYFSKIDITDWKFFSAVSSLFLSL